MARIYYTGFETGVSGVINQTETTDGTTAASGTVAIVYTTSPVHTGSKSAWLNLASGQTGYFTPVVNRAAQNTWARFYFRVTTMPTADRAFAGEIQANVANLRLTSTGAVTYYDNTTLLATSDVLLTTGSWYMIEYRAGSATGVSLRINGADQGGSITPATGFRGMLGNLAGEASAIEAHYDDYSIDDAAWCGEGGVVLLLPTANSAVGTGWVGGAGGAASFAAVDNVPPVGVADTGTDASQIRNATAAANSNYDATMTTYTAAGITTGAVVNSVVPIVWTAAPVTTQAKAGTVGVSSNPTIANVSLAAGGTSGAFWSGTAGGTWPNGWKLTRGTVTALPTVTLGTAPVMRITQVTSSTRIAMVCFMAIYVDFTPPRVPYSTPYPQLLAH